eukprot:EG_transcript_10378
MESSVSNEVYAQTLHFLQTGKQDNAQKQAQTQRDRVVSESVEDVSVVTKLHYNLALALSQSGDIHRAWIHCNHALQVDPNHVHSSNLFQRLEQARAQKGLDSTPDAAKQSPPPVRSEAPSVPLRRSLCPNDAPPSLAQALQEASRPKNDSGSSSPKPSLHVRRSPLRQPLAASVASSDAGPASCQPASPPAPTAPPAPTLRGFGAAVAHLEATLERLGEEGGDLVAALRRQQVRLEGPGSPPPEVGPAMKHLQDALSSLQQTFEHLSAALVVLNPSSAPP